MRKVKSGQCFTVIEHPSELRDLSSVEAGEVDVCEAFTTVKHVDELRDICGVEVGEVESGESRAEKSWVMLVTFAVSKWDTSSEVKASQYQNMFCMSVTSEVLRCSSPSMVISDLNLQNQ